MFSSFMELGFFLVCVGGMFYLFTKGAELIKRTRASTEEKGLEKKKE